MKYCLFFITFLIFSINILAQVTFVPVNNDIYDFLEKLYVKGIIDLDDVEKPYSRNFIAEKLHEALKKIDLFTKVEKEELEFYNNEYIDELRYLRKEKILPSLRYLGVSEEGRFHFFSYVDSIFTFKVDPIVEYNSANRNKGNIIHGRNGASILGYFSNFLGYSLYFYDNTERGENIDYTREFSELTGFSYILKRKNGIDYDDVNASLTYNWNWGYVSLMKDYLKWGSGRSGQLILSDKAPSFPMLRLNINPVDWLNFEYIHGYLNSNVIDSSSIRHNIGTNRVHYLNIPKFIAAHILSIKPTKNLNLSVGESIIYSDKFEPIYLIPIIFFRIADHNNAADQMTSGNLQLFGDISYRIPTINSIVYGSLFIDELSIADKDPSAIGYTLGYQVFDPFINDLDLNIEYTRIDPFVYFHPDDAQGYSNYNYQLGHWIGSNGDQFYVSIGKSLMRGLKLKAYGEIIRKGQKELQTEPRYQSWQTFLYGLRTNYAYYGIDLKYEIIHSLFVNLNYRYSSIDHEQKDHSFINEKYNDFSAGFSYGL